MDAKKLYRLDKGMLAGVCGGIGEYFNIDANIIRVIWILFCFLGGAGIPAYIIVALLLPKKSDIYPGY